MGRSNNRNTENVATITLWLGMLVVVIGGLEYGQKNHNNPRTPVSTSITQRYFATEQAKREGRNDYSFTTSFIPGMGIINDPQAYLDKLKTQNK